MPVAHYDIGQSFPVQFVWKLPNGDYLRAVFEVDVVGHVEEADKYIVRLRQLIAGRQETAEGEMRPLEAYSREYWRLVGQLTGNKITVAYEVDDGRPLHLRLATLTGEHNFFWRFARFEDPEKWQNAWLPGRKEKEINPPLPNPPEK